VTNARVGGPKYARIILNPLAGQAEQITELHRARALWEAHGWKVEWHATGYAGHAIELAREGAACGCDLVVAAGGDGTVNEVVNGIAGTRTALAALPFGTGNVWARELKLPLKPEAAAAALLEGAPYALDLGLAGDRYFLLMAGVGFDAAVTRMTRPDLKRRFGILAYLIQALTIARDVRGTRARIVLDGRAIRGRVLMVVIGNSRLYGGYLQITHHASLTDGLLDIAVIKGQNARSAPMHLLSIFLKRHDFNPDLLYYRAREITISGTTPLDIQVDGDPVGATPMTFRVAPRALQAWLPPNAAQELLFAAPPPRFPAMIHGIRRVLIDRPSARS
jgi:YegS/Rv2252/BmrU family lipid kinase